MLFSVWVVNGVWVVWSPTYRQPDHQPVADRREFSRTPDTGQIRIPLGVRQVATSPERFLQEL